jgi:hypothetical protein
MKVYAEIAPVNIVKRVAGMRALGAFPKAAIPVEEGEGSNMLVNA